MFKLWASKQVIQFLLVRYNNFLTNRTACIFATGFLCKESTPFLIKNVCAVFLSYAIINENLGFWSTLRKKYILRKKLQKILIKTTKIECNDATAADNDYDNYDNDDNDNYYEKYND